MALTQVASDHCADILVNLPLLADFQRRATSFRLATMP